MKKMILSGFILVAAMAARAETVLNVECGYGKQPLRPDTFSGRGTLKIDEKTKTVAADLVLSVKDKSSSEAVEAGDLFVGTMTMNPAGLNADRESAVLEFSGAASAFAGETESLKMILVGLTPETAVDTVQFKASSRISFEGQGYTSVCKIVR